MAAVWARAANVSDEDLIETFRALSALRNEVVAKALFGASGLMPKTWHGGALHRHADKALLEIDRMRWLFEGELHARGRTDINAQGVPFSQT